MPPVSEIQDQQVRVSNLSGPDVERSDPLPQWLVSMRKEDVDGGTNVKRARRRSTQVWMKRMATSRYIRYLRDPSWSGNVPWTVEADICQVLIMINGICSASVARCYHAARR